MSSGRDFTTENFFGYTLLATGTITGFTFSLNGKPIAKGSRYSLSASELTSALETSIFAGNALPLFNLWFSIPTIVSGTAPIVEGNLENLLPEYVNIKAIDITSGAVSVSAAKFKTDENVLNKISAGFSISDTSTKVQPELGALAADVTHINSISFTNPSPVIKLTAAEETADAGALAKISSAYILDVQSTERLVDDDGARRQSHHSRHQGSRYDHRRRLGREFRLQRGVRNRHAHRLSRPSDRLDARHGNAPEIGVRHSINAVAA